MERFKIESFTSPGGDGEIIMEVHCNTDMLIAGLTKAIIEINDMSQGGYCVKNGFWLMLNREINDVLKERAEKR